MVKNLGKIGTQESGDRLFYVLLSSMNIVEGDKDKTIFRFNKCSTLLK